MYSPPTTRPRKRNGHAKHHRVFCGGEIGFTLNYSDVIISTFLLQHMAFFKGRNLWVFFSYYLKPTLIDHVESKLSAAVNGNDRKVFYMVQTILWRKKKKKPKTMQHKLMVEKKHYWYFSLSWTIWNKTMQPASGDLAVLWLKLSSCKKEMRRSLNIIVFPAGI